MENVDILSINLGNSRKNMPSLVECDLTSSNPYEKYIASFCDQETKNVINEETKYVCNNYSPLPVILSKGKGIYLQDIHNNIYIDFLSGYSSLNFGHCDKYLVEKMTEQMNTLHMTSRAFYNNHLWETAKLFLMLLNSNYEKVLFMNTGAEAVESAIKIARRWGYEVKKIPDNAAEVVFMNGNFHGRAISLCGGSDDLKRYNKFGPYNPGYIMCPYDNILKLEEILKNGPNICAVLLEPIQGENGIKIPSDDYLTNVKSLCEKYNCLMIVDEIQTGMFRCGYLAYSRSVMKNNHPDLLLFGKSLSSGLYPVSAVVSSTKIMDLIHPGEHGSTYGANPLAMKAVFSTIVNLTELTKTTSLVSTLNIKEQLFYQYLFDNYLIVKEIRGRGLFMAIELYDDVTEISAYNLSLLLMENGILCKPTKNKIIRLSPPIIINELEIYNSCVIIKNSLKLIERSLINLKKDRKTNFNFSHFNNKLVETLAVNRNKNPTAGVVNLGELIGKKIENQNDQQINVEAIKKSISEINIPCKSIPLYDTKTITLK